MRVLGLRLGPVRDAAVRERHGDAPTYLHLRSTVDGEPQPNQPERYEERRCVGSGADAFAAARNALRSWVPQRSLGATITPRTVRPDPGETVVLGFGVGPARLHVPTRIVAVIDEPDRYGFAYGTLPGHPERGEELFLIERSSNDDVVCTIRVDARPAHQLRGFAFVIGPIQRAALRRYLSAIARSVRRASAGHDVQGGPDRDDDE